MTKTSTKTCDHCGTPAKRRYAVRITKRGHTKVAMVGSSCAKRFPRANQSDLIRSLGYDQSHDAAVYDDLVAKYPEHKEAIELFKRSDPSGGKSKYLKWQVSMLVSGVALAPEIVDVTRLFHRFQEKLEKRDIYQWKPAEFTDLRDRLFELEDLQTQKSKQESDAKASCESETVYESEKFRVILIKNKAASIHYGRGTKWCIRLESRGYFEDYDKNNVVFFFIFNKTATSDDPLYRVAISYQRDKENKISKTTYWDSLNRIVQNDHVATYYGTEFSKISEITRAAAAKVPKSILAKLAAEEASVKEIAQAYAYAQQQPDPEYKNRVNELVAANPKTPRDLLALLAKDTDVNVRFAVAENPNTPRDLLALLAKDANVYVRGGVAINIKTPRDLLALLAKDADTDVRHVAESNLKLRERR